MLERVGGGGGGGGVRQFELESMAFLEYARGQRWSLSGS